MLKIPERVFFCYAEIIMMNAKNRIEAFRRILSEALDSPDVPGKVSMVLMIRKIIRNEEIGQYRKFYFDSECYFGFLLLQSQIFEEQVREIIKSYELILDKQNKQTLKFTYKTPLEKLPLGGLLAPLSYYISYEKLISSIRDFNTFRIKIIHRLADDYDVELAELEQEIVNKYLTNEFEQTGFIILETARRVNLLLSNLSSPDSPVVSTISDYIKSSLNLQEEVIKFNLYE